MAIQHRRGAKADFNAQKMLAGEMAVTIDGSRKVYVAFAPGDVKELASKEDVQNIVDDFTDSVDEKISEAVEQVTTEAEEQIAAVIQKGEEVLDSIPADYQEIAESVAQHETEIATLTQSKSDAITAEKSGTSIVATDSSDKGFEQFRTYGWSKQEKTSGNQLLDMSDAKGGTNSGITVTVNDDGSYSYVGTATSTAINVWLFGGYYNTTTIFTLKAGTYYVKGIILYNKETPVNIGSNFFTLTTDTDVTGVRVVSAVSGDTYNTIVYPIVALSDVAVEWEPYTNGPSPNPEYPQPIVSAGQKLVDGVVTDVGISKKLTGKNLLKNTATSQTVNGVTFTVNEDGSVTANGTATADTIFVIPKIPLSVGMYILSGCPIGGNLTNTFDVFLTEYASNTTIARDYDGSTKQAFTLTEGVDVGVRIRVRSGYTVSNLVFKPMIRLASIEDDTYEPYTEQTLTLNRVLRGIPLGTDIPEMFKSNALHMDGIYWNEEEQQYYIADTIDAERGVLVQRVGESTLTFNDITNVLTDTHELRTRIPINTLNTVNNYILCDKATRVQDRLGVTTTWNYDHVGIMAFVGSSKQYIAIRTPLDVTSLEADVQYILATPIETPLTDEEIIAYKALHSNKPTTIITNDAGCFMEVEYVADTKNHIAQNYVPVSKYTALEERVSALEQLHV